MAGFSLSLVSGGLTARRPFPLFKYLRQLQLFNEPPCPCFGLIGLPTVLIRYGLGQTSGYFASIYTLHWFDLALLRCGYTLTKGFMVCQGVFCYAVEMKKPYEIDIVLPGYKCQRCGNEWPKRIKDREPKACPKWSCKSPNWRQPRVAKVS